MTTWPDTPHGNILKTLAGYGVITATILFSGGGDSGAIDDIQADMISGSDKGAAELAKIPILAADVSTYGGSSLNDLLFAISNELLQETGQDWYNNEGGGGTIEIMPGTGRIFVNMHYNIQTTEDCPVDYSMEVVPDTPMPDAEVVDG